MLDERHADASAAAAASFMSHGTANSRLSGHLDIHANAHLSWLQDITSLNVRCYNFQ